MSRGTRYDGERKLNIKKVIAVIIAFAIIIMFCIGINKLIKSGDGLPTKVVPVQYFSVNIDDKWGVIDVKGEIIIEAIYDEMIIIPDNTIDVFICTTNVDYTNGTYNTKVLNQKNKEIFDNYDLVEPIENYDEDNVLWYEKDVLKVKKDGLYGLIDLKGKTIVATEYEDIYSLKGTSNSLICKKDEKLGLLDNTGAKILENNYVEIKAISSKFENGYIVKEENGNVGVINWSKTVAVESEYEEIKPVYGDGYYVVKQDGIWQIVDVIGEIYLKDKFDDVISINNKHAVIKVDGKYGVINIEQGNYVINGKYQEIKYGSDDKYIFKLDGKYGIMDMEQNVLIKNEYENLIFRSNTNFYEAQKADNTSDMIDTNMEVRLNGIITNINVEYGYMTVRIDNDYKYYNFKFEEKEAKELLKNNEIFLSKQDGKYGFIDANGIVIVNYIYDDATEQNEFGYASVKKDGLWGTVDWNGTVIVEPKYNLDNNIKVEFIGIYHIGEDLNLNYYTNK